MIGMLAVNIAHVAIATGAIAAFVLLACLTVALIEEGGWHAFAGVVLAVVLLFLLLLAGSYRLEHNKRTLVCEDQRSGDVIVTVCR